MTLWRVAVRVRADEAEVVLARLLDLAPGGLEEQVMGDDVELAAYLDDEAATALLTAFPAATRTVVPEGWEDAWKVFHRPVTVGGIWIGPPWESPPGGTNAVVIDPGRAFGTGSHATTRLCVELLALLEPASLLDVGCGSGVLSLAAARLGFGPLVAIDSDPVAVEVTLANARANGVDLDARVVDATSDVLPAADVAVVNVLLRPVEEILTRLDVRAVVTSGYLDGELPAHDGWTHGGRLEADGWAADRFDRV